MREFLPTARSSSTEDLGPAPLHQSQGSRFPVEGGQQLPETAEGNIINILDQRLEPDGEFFSYTISKAGL